MKLLSVKQEVAVSRSSGASSTVYYVLEVFLDHLARPAALAAHVAHERVVDGLMVLVELGDTPVNIDGNLPSMFLIEYVFHRICLNPNKFLTVSSLYTNKFIR